MKYQPNFISRSSVVAAAVFVCLFAIPALTQAATLMVDINGGGGPTNSGWTAFSPVGPTTYTDALGAGMNVTVATSQVGAERNKNRGTTITGDFASLSDMLKDFYGSRNVGDTVTLTLSLAAGSYDFLSYHHDAENSSNTQNVTVGIVSNANITGVTNASSSFTMQSGTSPTTANLDTYSTKFTLVMPGDVSFTSSKTTGTGEHGFNGFVLSTVPEPSTLLLVAASVAMMGVRRRR